MKPTDNKLLVLQVAALGWDLAESQGATSLGGLDLHPAETIFPAVTCPVQATMRTGLLPEAHGVLANGVFVPRLNKALFWEQSCDLVRGERIWKAFREKGKTVGMMFWQQSLGEQVDLLLSPAPIHKHHGGMIQDCYTKPVDLYARLCKKIGRPFNLMRYWGPLASPASSRWIADSLCAVMAAPDIAPDLLFGYLPGLDYDLQRYGPNHPKSAKAWRLVTEQIDDVIRSAEANGYGVLLYGDYAITACPRGAVYPNRALRNAGFFATRPIEKMLYPDLHASGAVALVDHEIALVHVRDPSDTERVRAALLRMEGIESVESLKTSESEGASLLMLVKDGYWLSYRWWDEPAEAPDYASHVDIHNKPGFDPCELFFGWPPGSVSQNDAKVGGTHGRAGPSRRIAWASNVLDVSPKTLPEISRLLSTWMDG